MDLLMDDAVADAEKSLENGQSSFHKLAGGVIAFLSATLGFEADIMKEASDRLADAEASAERDRKRAVKENHQTGRLPPGIEYALCNAEAQLMSAVVGLLSESVAETLKSFYRLRTAYKTLEGIHNSLEALDFKIDYGAHSDRNTPEGSIHDESEKTPGSSSSSISVKTAKSAQSTSNDKPLEMSMGNLSLKRSSTKTRMSRDEVEIFTASGCSLCFGVLLLLLGMVPPSLGRVMSIVGFKGDRRRGLSMLWDASKAENVHGAIATLIILNYYGNALQTCDIVAADNEEGGYPQQKCHDALVKIRQKYPNSALWKLEEARMEAVAGRLEAAVETLERPVKTEMRQVEALMLFEKSINSMFLHRYQAVADGFLKLTTLNKWSHGLYTYFAASCYVELYRQHKDTSPSVALTYATQAESLLLKVPTYMGRKRFMAQGLPLEIFSDRKVKKWQARATAKGVRLVDGVGVSPIEEMIYIWNGYKRQSPEALEQSLMAIKYGDEEVEKDTADEKAIRWLLESVVMRRKGELQKAKELLVMVVEKQTPAQAPFDMWMAPAAHYELAVCHWKTLPEFSPYDPSYKEELEKIKNYLTKASGFSQYELDTRIGLKIQTALDTVNHAMEEAPVVEREMGPGPMKKAEEKTGLRVEGEKRDGDKQEMAGGWI
ncbi:hypothetical protein FPQ18DRAFT_392455 [Pyronema domesticum]|nr:hypothetical protein FPQ18DRAFT_392455 [Pyronema domesticum]